MVKSGNLVRPLYLREFWEINFNITTIEKFTQLTEEERYQTAVELLLRAIFMVKRELDIGMRIKIYNDIFNDSKIFEKIRKKIIRFSNKYLSFTSEILDEDQPDLYDSISFEPIASLLREENVISNVIVIPTTIHKIQEKFLFFKQYWKSMMLKGKTKEAIAVENLLLELETGTNLSHRCCTLEFRYDENFNYNKYQYKGLNSTLKHIKSFIFDYIFAQKDNLDLVAQLRIITDNNLNPIKNGAWELFKDFLGLVELDDCFDVIKFEPLAIDLGIFSKKYFLQDFALDISEIFEMMSGRYDRNEQLIRIAFADFLNVISLIYWDLLPFNEKINLINTFYSLDYVFKGVQDNLSLINSQNMIILIHWMRKFDLFPQIIDLIEEYVQVHSNTLNDYNLDHLLCIKAFSHLRCNQDEFCNSILKKREIKFSDILKAIRKDPIYVTKSIPEKGRKVRLQLDTLLLYLRIYSILSNKNPAFLKKLDNFVERLNSSMNKNGNPAIIRRFLIILANIEKERHRYLEEYKLLTKTYTQFENDYDKWISNRDKLKVQLRLKEYDSVDLDLNRLKEFDKQKSINQKISKSLLFQTVGAFQYAVDILKPIEAEIGTYDKRMGITFNEVISFPLFYLDRYKDAIIYLERALELESDDAYFRSYILLLKILVGEVEKAKIHFKHMMKLIGSDPRSYFYYRHFLRNLISFFGLNEFQQKIMVLINSYTGDSESKSDLLIDIGNILADLGYTKPPFHFFKIALRRAITDSQKATILNNIGSLYTNWGKYTEALRYYEKAKLCNDKNIQIYRNLAKNYFFQLNNIKAEETLEEALQIAKNQSFPPSEIENILIEIFQYSAASRSSINLTAIPFQEVKDHFLHAERLVKSYLMTSTLGNVANSVIIGYCNGLECYLHETIARELIELLKIKYGDREKRIPRSDWDLLGDNLRLLRLGRRISLGRWNYLLKSFTYAEEEQSDVLHELKSQLPLSLTNQMSKIIEVTDFFYPIRNKVAHGKIITFDKFKTLYSQMIRYINETIEILSPLCHQDNM